MFPQVIESCSCTEIYLNEYAKNRHFVGPHTTMSPTKYICSKVKALTNINKRIKLIEEIVEALSDLKDNFIAERNQLKKSQQNYNNKNKKEGIRNCKNTYHDIIKIYPKRKSKSEYEEILKKIELKDEKTQKNQRQKTKTGGKCEHPVNNYNEVFPMKHKIGICNCTNLKNNEKYSKIKSESIESIQYFLESILGKSESENTINLNDNNCNNFFNPTNQKSVSAENKELDNKCVCHRKQYIDEMPSYSKPKLSSVNSNSSELMWKEWDNQNLDRTSTDKLFERDSSEIKIVNIKEILDLISSGKDCPTEVK